MDEVMRSALHDCSTKDEFLFALDCAECGARWVSPGVRFSRAGIEPESEGKRTIFAVLYGQEKEAARRQAVELASEAFSVCPICGRAVCDNCFLICDELDMCRSCAGRLCEPGEPVEKPLAAAGV